MIIENKYYELDKRMSEKIREDMLKGGITEYPTDCQECKGEGCKDCNNTGEVWYEV